MKSTNLSLSSFAKGTYRTGVGVSSSGSSPSPLRVRSIDASLSLDGKDSLGGRASRPGTRRLSPPQGNGTRGNGEIQQALELQSDRLEASMEELRLAREMLRKYQEERIQTRAQVRQLERQMARLGGAVPERRAISPSKVAGKSPAHATHSSSSLTGSPMAGARAAVKRDSVDDRNGSLRSRSALGGAAASPAQPARTTSAGPGRREKAASDTEAGSPFHRGSPATTAAHHHVKERSAIPEEAEDGVGPAVGGTVGDDAVGAAALVSLGRDLLGAVTDLDRVATVSREGAARVLDCESADLFLYNAGSGELIRSVNSKAAPARIGKGIIGHVAETRKVFSFSGDVTAHPLYHAATDAREPRMTSVLVAPIFAPVDDEAISGSIMGSGNLGLGAPGSSSSGEPELLGVLRVVNIASGAFTPTDEASVAILTSLIAPAIRAALQFRSRSNSQAALGALLDVSKALSAEHNVNSLVSKIMVVTSSLLECDRCSFFVPDDNGTTLSSIHAELMAEAIRVPIGVGIVGKVFASSTMMNIDDVYKHSDFNSTVDKTSGFRTRNILACPVIGDKGDTVGVIEMINKREGPFTDDDEKLLWTLAGIAGVHLEKSKVSTRLVEQTHLSEAVIHLSTEFSNKNKDVSLYLEDAVAAVQSLCDADRASLFFLDKQANRLYSRVAQGAAGRPISFSVDVGIAGYVARTGEVLNIANPYADPRFNPQIDAAMGYKTSSILCLPVLNGSGDVVGVVQAVNKRGGTAFTRADEGKARAVVVFVGCAVTKMYSSWLERIGATVFMDKKLGTPSPGYFSLEQAGPIADNAQDAVATWQAKKLRDPVYHQVYDHLDLFTFNPFVAAGDSQLLLLLDLTAKWDLFEKLNVDPLILYRFLRAIRAGYHDVPYHCFYHAMDTAQTGHAFVVQSAQAQSLFTESELLAFIIGAVCHDVGHPGTNNAFQMAARTGVSIIFNDKGVLENYHASRSFSLMYQDEFNFTAAMTPKDQTDFRRTMIELILATDMSRHFEIVGKVKSKIEKGETLDKGKPDDRLMIQQMLIKAADIGNVIKPWDISNLWADRLLDEFFKQGDLERANNLPVTPFMDREKVVRSKSQIGFISFMAVPLYQNLALAVPELDKVWKELNTNLDKWKEEEAAGR